MAPQGGPALASHPCARVRNSAKTMEICVFEHFGLDPEAGNVVNMCV